ncbi:hypothetical protein [Thermococcus sp.]|uniref:hypothetical protein n=1 Tax=Thermococcus sp. TaxID=35749 RepID=UPI002602CDD0|nr:hypothetical protein [Thermococcus sp.]
MRRTLFVLLLAFTLSLLGVWGAYITVERSHGFIGPAVMAGSKGGISYVSLHAPGWMVLNASFNGNGDVVVLNQFSNETVFSSNVRGHLNCPIAFPEEGSYAVYTPNGSLTFSAYYNGVYPTARTQKALYASITVLAFALAIWRWRG